MESHIHLTSQKTTSEADTSEADKHFQSLSTLISLQGKFIEVVDSSLRKYNGLLGAIKDEQKSINATLNNGLLGAINDEQKSINASLKQIMSYSKENNEVCQLAPGQCTACSFTQLHYQTTLEIKQHKTCLCKLIQDLCICCLTGYETLLMEIPVVSIFLPQPVFFHHEICNAKTMKSNIISRSHDDNISFLTAVESIRNKAFSRFTYPKNDFSLNITTKSTFH